jgi:NADH-quinone oxidoreductase subunit J
MLLAHLESLYFTASIILIFSCVLVFLADNTVHSVLFLILAFFNSSILLFVLNIEFLGVIFIIIYVGAIAVLFLFIIMMLSNKIFSLNFKLYYILYFFFAYCFFKSVFYILKETFLFSKEENMYSLLPLFLIDNLNILNIQGQMLFNYHNSSFLLAGFVLLVGIVGSIVLSLNFNNKYENQLTYRQLSRSEKSFFFR